MHTREMAFKKVVDGNPTVGIVGLGYVGLPLLAAFWKSGMKCLGFDIDAKKVTSLIEGKSYIKSIPDKLVKEWMDSGDCEVTADMRRLAEADAILICVPTPLDCRREPDLSFIRDTVQAIALTLRPGQLVVLESTTYPTTTRDVVIPLLEKNPSGLKCGEDYFVAYSPEREDPGNAMFSTENIPKVVGAADEFTTVLATRLYWKAISEVVPVDSLEVAEACKILENTYRAVNIALVNELKVLFDKIGIDIWQVIAAARTKPFGFQAFYPGPGLGGHCIPIDPFYLSWLARQHGEQTKFIELAGEVNLAMPEYVVDVLEANLVANGKTLNDSLVCILGMAYKKDIDDPRESPSFEIMDLLINRGAKVSYSDPHIARLPKMRNRTDRPMGSKILTETFLQSQDAVIIATDHTAFDYEQIVRSSRLVIDTRNATRTASQNVGHGLAQIVRA